MNKYANNFRSVAELIATQRMAENDIEFSDEEWALILSYHAKIMNNLEERERFIKKYTEHKRQ